MKSFLKHIFKSGGGSRKRRREMAGIQRLQNVLEKEMQIFTNEEDGFAFQVHPTDQVKLEKLLKAKKWEYRISKAELANGYLNVTIPNDYVFMDGMSKKDVARVLTEYGIRILKNREEDNGKEVVKTCESKKAKKESDFYWEELVKNLRKSGK